MAAKPAKVTTGEISPETHSALDHSDLAHVIAHLLSDGGKDQVQLRLTVVHRQLYVTREQTDVNVKSSKVTKCFPVGEKIIPSEIEQALLKFCE